MPSKVRVCYICCCLFVHVASHSVITDHQIVQAEMFSFYLQSTQTYPFSFILLPVVIIS